MTKFRMKFNGSFLCGVDKDTFLPFSVPYCLAHMKGGVATFDLVENLFTQIASFMNITNNASEKINHYLPETGIDFRPSTPTYFKLGTIKRVIVEDKEIHLSLSKTLLVGNCGDGVSVNTKAATVIKEFYGIKSSSFRCAAHAANGSLKHISKSETMCVEEVKLFYNTQRSAVHFFQYSIKGKKALDLATEIVEMQKGMHLISWCVTRMAHLLSVCEKANDLLVPLYNTMYSSDIKQEE